MTPVARNLLESHAKDAYNVWATAVGATAAWEELPNVYQQGWVTTVQFLADEPKCGDCGADLFCLDCDAEEAFACMVCETKLTCPKCGTPGGCFLAPDGILRTPASAEGDGLAGGRGTAAPSAGEPRPRGHLLRSKGMISAKQVYDGSDGDLTKAYYAELEKHGPIGIVCVNLFRAQKCSTRAKAYRGGIRGVGSFKGLAYDRKNWSMQNLCKALMEHGQQLGIDWGWKRDPAQEYHDWVLYVELPDIGQVSFHAASHGEGPNFHGEWDGKHLSAERILAFCDLVASQETASAAEEVIPEGRLRL